MGRPKGDATRSKTRPSSSSLAAELLHSASGGAATIGFGGFAGGERLSRTQQQQSLELQDVSQLKALFALQEIFQNRSANELVPLLHSWVFVYKRLAIDTSRQVRESANVALGCLARSVGRNLGPHLKSLMGAWWVAQFDPWKEVAEAARTGFQGAFPMQKKQLEALVFCREEVFVHLDENLKLTPQTMGDKLPPEEAAEKHERVLSSSLLAFVTLLEVLDGAQISMAAAGRQQQQPDGGAPGPPPSLSAAPGEPTSCPPVADQSTAQACGGRGESAKGGSRGPESREPSEVAATAARVCQVHGFFKDLVRSKSPVVRSAVYQALRVVCERAGAVVEDNLAVVAPIVLGAFAEREASCHWAMWEMVLSFVNRFPRSWYGANLRKMVWPRFWAFLRHACYGSVEFSYPCMVVLISRIPPDVVIGSSTSEADFFMEFFGTMWQGRTSCAGMAEVLSLLKALRECLLFVLLHSQKYVANKGNGGEEAFQSSLGKGLLVNMCWREYVGRSTVTKGDDTGASASFPQENSSLNAEQVRERDKTHAVSLSKDRKEAMESSSFDVSRGGLHQRGAGDVGGGGQRLVASGQSGMSTTATVRRMPPGWFRELGDWILNTVSTIGARQRSFLRDFWAEVASECKAMVEESNAGDINSRTTSSGKGDDIFLRIGVFYERLGKQKGLRGDREGKEDSVMMFAVQPLVARLLPVVMRTSHAEALGLLARIVRCYGPGSFDAAVAAATTPVPETTESGVVPVGHSKTQWFVANVLVGWCLAKGEGDESVGNYPLSPADRTRIDLITAFVRYPDMIEVWASVVQRLTCWVDEQSMVVQPRNLAVLSFLLEGMVKEAQGIEKLVKPLEDSVVSTEVQKRLDDLAIRVAGSSLLTSEASTNILRVLLTSEASSKGIGRWIALSSEAILPVLRLLLSRVVDAVVSWPTAWAPQAVRLLLGSDVELSVIKSDGLHSTEKLSEAHKVELGREAMKALSGWVMSSLTNAHADNVSIVRENVVAAAFVVKWLRDSIPLKTHQIEDIRAGPNHGEGEDTDDWNDGDADEEEELEEELEQQEEEEEGEENEDGKEDDESALDGGAAVGTEVTRLPRRKGKERKKKIGRIAHDKELEVALASFAATADDFISSFVEEVKMPSCSNLRHRICPLVIELARVGILQSEEGVEGSWWASRGHEVIESLCCGDNERAESIDMFVKPCGQWPKWVVKPEDSEMVEKPLIPCRPSTEGSHDEVDRAYWRIAAFIAALATRIGPSEVFGTVKVEGDGHAGLADVTGNEGKVSPDMSILCEREVEDNRPAEQERGNPDKSASPSGILEPVGKCEHASAKSGIRNRAWLVVELLCAWEWPGGSAVSDVLPFLQSRSCGSSGEDAATVKSVVDALFHGATKSHGDGDCLRDVFSGWMCETWEDEYLDIREPFLRGLVCVAGCLVRKGVWAVEETWTLFYQYLRGMQTESSGVSGNDHDGVVVRVLRQVMPVLRGASVRGCEDMLDRRQNCQHLDSEQLQGTVEVWLRQALDAVPILGSLQDAEAEYENKNRPFNTKYKIAQRKT
ncbi:hypothetical protein CBR_g30901 [Chara braunii]|uniref:E3 ubiquitin-protein ligase listerin n=1 Tax=Chara braunii TaxID=69332 RepID=A0A388LDT9_CHABU|nr:hypothetical protein CBR_g30901 [Chara braunii]|eukprot:GBG80437.1 hypothetical protein CBR_g30901 [Chara braunii]